MDKEEDRRGGTHGLRVVVVRPSTTRPREDGTGGGGVKGSSADVRTGMMCLFASKLTYQLINLTTTVMRG